MSDHTHECRRCGADIDCGRPDAECVWEGDNVGCPDELAEYAAEPCKRCGHPEREHTPNMNGVCSAWRQSGGASGMLQRCGCQGFLPAI